MTDNITLPRKHIDYAAHALEHFNKDAPDPLVSEIIHHLRTALAAEQPKPSSNFDNQGAVLLLRSKSAEIERLKADSEALRRDAERYRWLRDKAPPDIGDMASVRDSHDPSEIDAAIDAAMGDKT